MISFGNAASSHSGLIPLKASKKRGELLWAIGSKKNFINFHSTAFVAVLARNLVHAYKFCICKTNRWINFFINLKIPRSINIPCKFQEHCKQGRLLNRTSNMTNFPPPPPPPPDFVFTSERPHYLLALFSSFICTCTFSTKKEICIKKNSRLLSEEISGIC